MDSQKTAGARLKRAIHTARAQSEIMSDMALSLKADVSYDTLFNWYSGRTVPRPHALRKVAEAMGANYADLWAAYEGRPAEEPPLTEAIRELVETMGELISELRASRVQPAPPRSSLRAQNSPPPARRSA